MCVSAVCGRQLYRGLAHHDVLGTHLPDRCGASRVLCPPLSWLLLLHMGSAEPQDPRLGRGVGAVRRDILAAHVYKTVSNHQSDAATQQAVYRCFVSQHRGSE